MTLPANNFVQPFKRLSSSSSMQSQTLVIADQPIDDPNPRKDSSGNPIPFVPRENITQVYVPDVGNVPVDAALELRSTSAGLLLNRMSYAQMLLLNATDGMVVYVSSGAPDPLPSQCLYVRSNGDWEAVGMASSSLEMVSPLPDVAGQLIVTPDPLVSNKVCGLFAEDMRGFLYPITFANISPQLSLSRLGKSNLNATPSYYSLDGGSGLNFLDFGSISIFSQVNGGLTDNPFLIFNFGSTNYSHNTMVTDGVDSRPSGGFLPTVDTALFELRVDSTNTGSGQAMPGGFLTARLTNTQANFIVQRNSGADLSSGLLNGMSWYNSDVSAYQQIIGNKFYTLPLISSVNNSIIMGIAGGLTSRGVIIGYNASIGSTTSDGVIIGYNASIAASSNFYSNNSVAIGSGAIVGSSATGSVAIGSGAIVNSRPDGSFFGYSIAFGYQASVGNNASTAIALGYQAVANYSNTFIISSLLSFGLGGQVNPLYSIHIGNSTGSSFAIDSPDGTKTCVFKASNDQIFDYYCPIRIGGPGFTYTAKSISFPGGSVKTYTQYGYLNGNTINTTGTSASVATPVSLIAEQRIVCSEFNAYSSAKIKNILEENQNILKKESVNLFKKISFAKYQYKDPREGHGDFYGLIAEKLREVMPNAVHDYVRFAPNIMKKASVSKIKEGEFLISFDTLINIASSSIVKFYLPNDLEKEGEILDVYSVTEEENIFTQMKVSCVLDCKNDQEEYHYFDEVFVYGTQDNCPTVAKEKAFELSMIVLQDTLERVESIEKMTFYKISLKIRKAISFLKKYPFPLIALFAIALIAYGVFSTEIQEAFESLITFFNKIVS